MAKSGFVVLVLVFGLFCFLSGMLAPDGLRQAVLPPAEAGFLKLAGLVGADMSKLTAGKGAAPGPTEGAAKPGSDKAAPGTSAQGAAGAVAPPAPGGKPIPLRQFRLPPADADPGTEPVGISVGLYATDREAKSVQDIVAGEQIPSAIYPVATGDGLTWILLAAGPYKTERDGIEDKERLRYLFGTDRRLDFVRWVKPPPAGK